MCCCIWNSHSFSFSDLIPDEFKTFLEESVISLEKNIYAEVSNLSVSKMGSLPIIEDFLSDKLDICIIAIPEEGEFPSLNVENLVKIPFAYISSVIVVNSDNPISEINFDQLYSIYGDTSSTSNFKNWRDLGVSSFLTSPIKAYAVKEENEISSDLFRFEALKGAAFSKSVKFGKTEEIERVIKQDKSSIGIFPSIPDDPELKILFLSRDNESIAYGPSVENLFYFDYQLRLPFYIIFDSMHTNKLYPLLCALLSDPAADILGKSNFFSYF